MAQMCLESCQEQTRTNMDNTDNVILQIMQLVYISPIYPADNS